MSDVIRRRFEEFNEAYEDLEPAEVGELIVEVGDLMEFVVGREAADATMLELYRATVGDPDRADCDGSSGEPRGRRIWRNAGHESLSGLEMSRDLAALHGYAFFGLPIDPRISSVSARADQISGYLSHYTEMLRHLPEGECWSDKTQIRRTIEAAWVRHAIDHSEDEGRIDVEGLAALARVSVKTVRNLLSPSSGSGFHVDEKGGIDIASARQWLEDRPEFRSSVWLFEEQFDDAEAPREPAELDPQDVLFVPVAKDGSMFTPDLVRNGAYQIGPKGAERRLASYREALQHLQLMDRAAWRRPNAADRWGIVMATHWLRKTTAELGLEKETA